MNSIVIVILIILCIIALVFIVKHSLKAKEDTITCYTGGLGSGKTFLTALKAILRYAKNLARYKWCWLIFHIKNFFRRKENKKKWTHEKPILVSNFPIGIKKIKEDAPWYIRFIHWFSPKHRRKQKYLMSYNLKIEHLLLQERLPLGSVVVIDEVGSVASQYDFSKHNVKEVMDEFFRFFRHYVSNPELKIQSYLYVNDQCSENIVLNVRRRINIIHNLSNFKLLFGHIAIYFQRQINISEEIKTIDTKQEAQEGDTQDNANLTFKFIWHKPKYDTYCYHDRYMNVPKGRLTRFKKYRKDDLLKTPFDKAYVPKTNKEKKQRKEDDVNGNC